MFINYKKIEAYLISWIKDQASSRGVKNLIINLQGNSAGSALALYLCKRTQIPVTAFIVDNKLGDNAVLFAFQYNVQHIYLDIDQSVSDHINTLNKIDDTIKIDNLVARTNIVNSYISTLATGINGLIVSPRFKQDHLYTRTYNKNDSVDILPFATLYKSEIDDLYQKCVDFNRYPAAKAIFSANPKNTDDFFSGVTFEELEWIDQLNERTKIGPKNLQEGIIESKNDPAKSARWFGFTIRQKEIIAKIHQTEKITKHKYNPNIPVCFIPENL